MALEQVLIVDDDEKQCDIYAYSLTQAGYEVLCLCDAVAALSYITVTPPDVLVIDYQMPQMNGLELLRQLQANDVTVPVVIMLTGTHLRTGDHARELQPYVNLILAKPFDPVQLRDINNKFAADHTN